jgi:peptidoglycan hydrolase-like protein with peptidoglycan-binding domain
MNSTQYPEYSIDLVNIADNVIASSIYIDSSEFLQRLLAETDLSTPPVNLGTGLLSPAIIFDTLSGVRDDIVRNRIEDIIEVIALPGEKLATSIEPGDLLLRRALGEGAMAHIAMLASSELVDYPNLADADIPSEQRGEGWYLEVVEGGANPHTSHGTFARKILDQNGRLTPDQMLLRLRVSPETMLEEYEAEEPDRLTAEGTNRISDPEYVHWIQERLNEFLGTNLVLDGAYGPITQEAVRSFQFHTGLVEDGIVGPATEHKLIEESHIEPPAVQEEPGGAREATRYGDYDLRRGDHDAKRRRAPVWSGVTQAASAEKHVEQLQRDLSMLGFRIVGTLDGAFGRRTEWAVREFQIYAKMKHVAVENTTSTAARYVDRLRRVATGGARYTGYVSGIVNRATRTAIQHWLKHNYRCPVIVEAWNMTGPRARRTRSNVHRGNIWLHNEVDSTRPRMYVRDFSHYYTFPAGRNPDDLIVLGDYATYRAWSGPRSTPPRHTWADAELLPDSLVGVPLASLSAGQLSTFKVVRAVSEEECLGFFDGVNAYDNAFVSVGPCQWTLGIAERNHSVNEGELCGYLAYLRYIDADAFKDAIEFFGVRVDGVWDGGGRPDGRSLFSSALAKYAGWVALQDDTGNFLRLRQREEEGNYFKTWHWFYRFVMAGRTIQGYRRRMWDMARVRIRDIRDVNWRAGVTSIPDGTPAGRPATIGDMFTSEKAMAIILRWHIRSPSRIIRGGNPGIGLTQALRRARVVAPHLNWAAPPNTWTDAHETALIHGLRRTVRALGNSSFRYSINRVDMWPLWATGANPRGYTLPGTIGRLDENRGSLRLDVAGLPPAPR